MMVQEKVAREDVFHLYELYLLAEATGNTDLFGLPDPHIYALVEPTYLEEAKQAVQQKGILDEEGHITKGGFFVIKALSEYATSSKYVQINNLMIASSTSEPDERIVLTEVEEGYYQMNVLEKHLVLKDLFESVPLIQREPLEEEKEFTVKKMRNRERRRIVGEEVGENALSLTVYDTQTTDTNEEQCAWLYFMEEDHLFMVNVEEEKYYRVSQYWFMKQLFDSLDIPYGTKETK